MTLCTHIEHGRRAAAQHTPSPHRPCAPPQGGSKSMSAAIVALICIYVAGFAWSWCAPLSPCLSLASAVLGFSDTCDAAGKPCRRGAEACALSFPARRPRAAPPCPPAAPQGPARVAGAL